MNGTRTGGHLRRWWRRPGTRRFSRFAVSSGVAFGVSNLVFLVAYGLELTSPQVATVLAYAVGVPTNYLLTRRWTWRRRGRPPLRTELLPYAAVVTVNVVAAAVGTWAVDRWLQSIELPRVIDVALVSMTFVAINGGLFVAKYVLLDRLVFRERPTGPPSDPADRPVQRVP